MVRRSGRAEACTQRTYGARVRARGWSGQRDARRKRLPKAGVSDEAARPKTLIVKNDYFSQIRP
jgi:hypothetical protein